MSCSLFLTIDKISAASSSNIRVKVSFPEQKATIFSGEIHKLNSISDTCTIQVNSAVALEYDRPGANNKPVAIKLQDKGDEKEVYFVLNIFLNLFNFSLFSYRIFNFDLAIVVRK